MPPRRIAGLPLFLDGFLTIVYGFLFGPDTVPSLLPLGAILTIIGARFLIGVEARKGRSENRPTR